MNIETKINIINEVIKDIFKVRYDTLVLEVTRRCNMRCAHCLRGDAQNLDIGYDIIDAVLEQTESINVLVFSGGEPGLNVAAIEYTLDKCIDLGIPVYAFYLVTNGKEITPDFCRVMCRWYAYTRSCSYDEGISAVALSIDMFHEEIPNESRYLLESLSFFNDTDKNTDWDDYPLIAEGRASENEIYDYTDNIDALRHYDPSVEVEDCYEYEALCVTEGTIYIGANGDVKTDCDTAYDNDTYTIMNVKDGKLIGNVLRDLFA